MRGNGWGTDKRMDARSMLLQIAERLGGEVRIDCTYRVTAAAGSLMEATAETVEGALAEYIAGLLNEDPGRAARLVVADPAPAVAGLPAAVNGSSAGEARVADDTGDLPDAQRSKRLGGNKAALAAENRARIAALAAEGLSAPEIVRRTGLVRSCVYRHLREMQATAAVAEEGDGPEAPFCGGEHA